MSDKQNEEADQQDTDQGISQTRLWIAIVGLNLGLLVMALDINIIATAVPRISATFNQYDQSFWLGTGMCIAFAISLPLVTHLGEVLGRKPIFVAATVVFAVGSVLCAVAKSMRSLIWGRVVQGVGSGGIYGLTNVIITELVPIGEAGRYLATTQIIWAVADIAGPLLGAVFTRYLTWRWCFWIMVILAPLSLIIIIPALKSPPRTTKTVQAMKQIDLLGLFTLCGGALCVLLGICWGGRAFQWTSPRILGLLIGGAVLIFLFFLLEPYATLPVFSPTILKNRVAVAMLCTGFFFGAHLFGMIYYIPQFFQFIFADSIMVASAELTPMMVTLAISSSLCGELIKRYGYSLPMVMFGAVLEVIASGLICRWNASTSRAEAMVLLGILGFGQGAVLIGMLLTAQTNVDKAQVRTVTGFVIFMQSVGDVFGIALFSTIFLSRLKGTAEDFSLERPLAEELLRDPTRVRELVGLQRTDAIQWLTRAQRSGWLYLFACSVALFICSLFGIHHGFVAPKRREGAVDSKEDD